MPPKNANEVLKEITNDGVYSIADNEEKAYAYARFGGSWFRITVELANIEPVEREKEWDRWLKESK